MKWKCPDCGSEELAVTVVETHECTLTQWGKGDFETEVDKGGDHIWDEESRMRCCECGYTGQSQKFVVPEEE